MPRILDIDLENPPEFIEPPEDGRLLLVGWKKGVPAGFLEQTIAKTVRGTHLASAFLAGLPPAAGPEPLPLPPSPPTISVIICTCGRLEDLTAALAAVQRQDYPPFEVVIVDNAPRIPGVRLLVEEQFPFCRRVPEPRRGVRFARNAGVRNSTGEILAFIDDDCQPVPGWLSALAAQFAARPGLGCCTGPILPMTLTTRAQELMEKRGGFHRGFTRKLFAREHGEFYGNRWHLQAWMFGSGGNMAFRRSVFSVIGPFDEMLRTAEDLEIFFRVIRGGFEIVYEPASAVRHSHVATYSELRRRLFLWGLGYVAYLLKVASEDSDYRPKALAEIASWFPYQVNGRLIKHLLQRDFPLDLLMAELIGGIAAIPDYFWRRMQHRRKLAVPARRNTL